jgi:hypothetical protein
MSKISQELFEPKGQLLALQQALDKAQKEAFLLRNNLKVVRAAE